MRLTSCVVVVLATAVSASAGVAQNYKAATQQLLYLDAFEIRNAVQDRSIVDDQNKRVDLARLFATLERTARERGVSAVLVIDSSGNILGQSVRSSSTYVYRAPSADSYASASENHIVVDADCKQPFATALARLEALQDAYLLVVRDVGLKQLCESS